MTFLSLVLIIGSPILYLIAHALIARFFTGKPSQGTAIFSILFTSIALTAVIFLNEHFSLNAAFFALICNLGIGHVYFHFFNMSETARRIRILTSAYQKRQISLHSDYKPDQLIAVRLKRLKDLGQIEEKNGQLVAHWGALRLASLILKQYEFFLFPERRKALSSLSLKSEIA